MAFWIMVLISLIGSLIYITAGVRRQRRLQEARIAFLVKHPELESLMVDYNALVRKIRNICGAYFEEEVPNAVLLELLREAGYIKRRLDE